MTLTIVDFDEAWLTGQAMFQEAVADALRQTFEPLALDAFAQQVRQYPESVQAGMKRKAPEEWVRLFGGEHDRTL